jgi:uncharacterized membrane protein (DUF4010 family)
MDFADIYPFLIAMLIGALIGTERQRRMIEDKIRGVAGLRTFILIALLGSLCSALAQHYGSGFAIAGMAAFTILASVGYATSVSALGRVDFTAAVATVVTFALGMLAGFPESTLLAVALAIITTWVLATRTITHRYVEALNQTDLLDTLKMGIIALVIYPFLPEEPLDPWGVLNPRQVWLFVVMVSLIGYVGYILIRILGAERGLSLTGILGGLVSSTAVTSSMAEQVRENREILPSAIFATAIASCTMFLRVLFIVLILNRSLFFALLIPLLLMTLAGFALAYMWVRKSSPPGRDFNVKDPFGIIPALMFGAFFAFILVVSKLANVYFGDAGIYAAGIVSGLADVDAITLTMASLVGTTLSSNVAVTAIILAAVTNTLVKLAIAYVLGTREFGLGMARIFLPISLLGLATLLFLR